MSVIIDQISRRHTGVSAFAVFAVCLGALIILGTGIGSSFMPPGRVIAALFFSGLPTDEVIIWTLRLPRVALAVLSGAALALAGALLQRVSGNVLASPSVLGISDGAAAGAVGFLAIFSNANYTLTVSIFWMPLAAFLGAILFSAITLLLGFAEKSGGTLRFILYGIAVAALAKAIVTLLLVLGPAYRAGQALSWLAGSVGSAQWSDSGILLCVLCLCGILLALFVRAMTQLTLDAESAKATGLALGQTQIVLLSLAAILTASAVAFVGAIGFVGLVAPHIARRVIREVSVAYLPCVALAGACLVLGADILARIAAPPLELPAGAFTAIVGAPLFLMLLLRKSPLHGR